MRIKERHYNKSSIVEAVCQIDFIQTDPNDATAIGRFYAQVQNRLPRHQTKQTFRATFGQPVIAPNVQSAQIVEAWADGSPFRIQIGTNQLRIAHPQPYTSWAEFKPFIDEMLSTYIQTMHPTTVQRAGMRYINHVVIADAANAVFIPSVYFNYYPVFPVVAGEHSSPDASGIQIACQLIYRGGADRLNLQLATLPGEGAMPKILLDFDYGMAVINSVKVDAISEWIETAHDEIYSAFEAVITDRTRNLLQVDA